MENNLLLLLEIMENKIFPVAGRWTRQGMQFISYGGEMK